MQGVIGRGLSRTKIILAKILDCAILALIEFALFAIFLFVMGAILGLKYNSSEIFYLVIASLMGAYSATGLSALAAVVIYATENTPLSDFVIFSLYTIVPILLDGLCTLKLFYPLHVKHYYFLGIANSALTDFMLGVNPTPLIIIGLVVYLGIAFALSMLVFSRKELEF